MEKATFAAGCFWGVEHELRQLPGVTGSAVGYTGGHSENPDYQAVCSHTTGHAEAVRIEFDPAAISYEQLVRAFFEMHDPTQLNRQGPDVGDQYRSGVFFHSPEQAEVARRIRDEVQSRSTRPVVTEITSAPQFWRAEEYHQRYFEKHGMTSCAVPSLQTVS